MLNVRSIRRSVCQPVLLSLVTSLVLTRLNYGSVTLSGITKRLMDRLQSVLNAAARLVITVVNTTAFHHFCATCTGCVSLYASSFVWPFLCFAVATRLHRTTWRETYSGQTLTTRGDDCDRRRLRSCSCVAHDYERSATALSALLHRAYGTTCLLTSFLHRHWPFSSGAWRLICLDNHSADNWPCYLSLKLCLRQDKYCR